MLSFSSLCSPYNTSRLPRDQIFAGSSLYSAKRLHMLLSRGLQNSVKVSIKPTQKGLYLLGARCEILRNKPDQYLHSQLP
jgi:hypothetical protein